jgi:hypothetical protein
MEPHERGPKMPCDFRTIRSTPFDLPTAGDIDIDLEFPAPGVNAERRAILMYRARVTVGGAFGGTATLTATLNRHVIFEQVYSGADDRSFHKILDPSIVRPADNKLTLATKPGGGTIQLSDIVLVYGL